MGNRIQTLLFIPLINNLFIPISSSIHFYIIEGRSCIIVLLF
nr:MAG TPA: hypothetical protein [Caudoviricetes sp.]